MSDDLKRCELVYCKADKDVLVIAEIGEELIYTYPIFMFPGDNKQECDVTLMVWYE